MTVMVLGSPAFTCDVLMRVLEPVDGPRGDTVVVLVNPTSEHWDHAYELDARIVLMDHRAADCIAVADAVLAGVDAVLDPDVGLGELRDTVARVRAGGTVLTASQARALAESARAMRCDVAPRLTRREREILDCLERGQSVKQTARELGVAHKTVENVRGRLFRKLGARNGGHALVNAADLGILGPRR